MSWDDTHLMLVSIDEKYAYFSVYVHDKVECHVKMELAAPYTGELCRVREDEGA